MLVGAAASVRSVCVKSLAVRRVRLAHGDVAQDAEAFGLECRDGP